MLPEAAPLRKGLMHRPFIAQRAVQKGQLAVPRAEAQQLLEALAALNPAAVIDHIRKGAPFARTGSAFYIVDKSVNLFFAGMHVGGGKHNNMCIIDMDTGQIISWVNISTAIVEIESIFYMYRI